MTSSVPPALQAAAEVLQRLLAGASGLLGLGALAYVIGLRETQSYFSAVGAPWVTSLLSPAQIMQSSAWIWVIAGWFVVSSVISIVNGATPKLLRRQSIASIVVGAVPLILAAFDLPADPQMRALLAVAGAVMFATSAAYTIGEVIALYKEQGLRWSGYQLYLLLFSCGMAFMFAPDRMGVASAQLATQQQTTGLPVAELASDDSKQEWHLLAVAENNAVLVYLTPEIGQNRFRVVALTDIRSVNSTKRAKTK